MWCGVAAMVALVSDNVCRVERCGAVLSGGGMESVCVLCKVASCVVALCRVVCRCRDVMSCGVE